MANRLADETSPYLLQHRDNPVDWWPWGPEALAEAKATNRPILLSVGYAACHWCHVMAHECFENPAIAAEINRLTIPIKIDREERPDLDAIYQQALGLMGQHGGWPLTMFLNPEGAPFWGGTYFPPTPRYGRPGFPEMLRAVVETWQRQPDKIAANVAVLTDALSNATRMPAGIALSMSLLDQGAMQLLQAVDFVHGGLGGAPKFPQPRLFDFLWRAHLRTGEPRLYRAVTVTLDALCRGGIYDHLGGGFMRYATDDTWLVPHFEKMLYDNAQLIDLLTLVWQRTGTPLYRTRVAETVTWLQREMIAEGGAFASSLDADSEGGEGAFYTWQDAEIDRLLPPALASRFKAAYDVAPGGNWEGRSILNLRGPIDAELGDARATLLEARAARLRPGRDDKVLADWNGLTIAALANAAFVFAQPAWLEMARTAYDTVRRVMALPDGRLAHAMRLGRVRPVGLLDDLAAMSRAALVLHEMTGETSFLDHARVWAAAADRFHWDEETGGWFQTVATADILVRPKSPHDSAVPSANGVMAEVNARLWLLTGDDSYRRRAEAAIAAFSGLVPEHFANLPSLLAAFEQLALPVQISITGTPAEPLLRAVAATSLPTRQLSRGNGSATATATVCRAAVCLPPFTDAARLREALQGR
ncbi:MAG: thioredoxin domain-containing protein [Magnetospirillum sp.]|nr:thioredoxin domain-containing protein [Magnetospirillum sp.]